MADAVDSFETCADLEDFYDTDVAGIGVIIAFGSSVVISLLAIIAAYLMRALPPDLYGHVDEIFLTWLETTRIYHAASHFWTHAVRRHTQTVGDASQTRLLRRHRMKGFERFILAVSDQQLISGLGILIAIFIKSDTLSAFSFMAGASLAWFSATTHLATLTVLREYLDRHKLARICRVVIMVSIALLLLAALFMSHAPLVNSITASAGELLSLPFRCVLGNQVPEPLRRVELQPYVCVALVFVFIVTVSAYVERLLEIFAPTSRSSNHGWFAWMLYAMCRPSDPNKTLSLARINRHYKRSNLQQMIDRYIHERQPTGQQKLASSLFLIYRSIEAMMQTFLWHLVWLLFYFSFSLTHLVLLLAKTNKHGYSYLGQQRFSETQFDFEFDSGGWGFGQILPLFLLLIPFLNGVEIYSEYRESRFDEQVNRHLLEEDAVAAERSQMARQVATTWAALMSIYQEQMIAQQRNEPFASFPVRSDSMQQELYRQTEAILTKDDADIDIVLFCLVVKRTSAMRIITVITFLSFAVLQIAAYTLSSILWESPYVSPKSPLTVGLAVVSLLAPACVAISMAVESTAVIRGLLATKT